MYALLLSLIAIRLFYYIFLFSKLIWHKSKIRFDRLPAVSIVVCVKNNLPGLKTLLAKLVVQNYKTYEIIIVDDFSEEEVPAFPEYKNVRICKPDADLPGKKMALTKGIQEAQYDYILVTDSDCVPASLDWIKHMAAAIDEKKKMVLGFGPYLYHKNWTSRLAQYENATIGMQYLAYALRGLPYMGVGRNMLFEKKLFLEAQPYLDNFHIASGDDDMFVQRAASKEHTTICLHPNSFCYSAPPQSLSQYFNQKVRHISTASSYRNPQKTLLTIFSITHLGIYAILIFNFFLHWFSLQQALAAYFLMMGIMLVVQTPVFIKLRSHAVLLYTPLCDFLLFLLYSCLSPFIAFSKNQKWK